MFVDVTDVDIEKDFSYFYRLDIRYISIISLFRDLLLSLECSDQGARVRAGRRGLPGLGRRPGRSSAQNFKESWFKLQMLPETSTVRLTQKPFW